MLSRRLLLSMTPAVLPVVRAFAQPVLGVFGEDLVFDQLTNPLIPSLNSPGKFGFSKPTQEQIEKANEALNGTPKDQHPIDIAESFIMRYAASDPERISQWPAPQTWNPLIVEFFKATSLRVNNDMVDWCAAFVNWCIVRNNKAGTNSAGSQSFITSGKFIKTKTPRNGDLAVFTCYDAARGKNLGIGHVGFFKADLGQERIRIVAGNQAKDRHSSIISEADFSTKPFSVKRHVNGTLVPCIFKLNSYLSMS